MSLYLPNLRTPQFSIKIFVIHHVCVCYFPIGQRGSYRSFYQRIGYMNRSKMSRWFNRLVNWINGNSHAHRVELCVVLSSTILLCLSFFSSIQRICFGIKSHHFWCAMNSLVIFPGPKLSILPSTRGCFPIYD